MRRFLSFQHCIRELQIVACYVAMHEEEHKISLSINLNEFFLSGNFFEKIPVIFVAELLIF